MKRILPVACWPRRFETLVELEHRLRLHVLVRLQVAAAVQAEPAAHSLRRFGHLEKDNGRFAVAAGKRREVEGYRPHRPVRLAGVVRHHEYHIHAIRAHASRVHELARVEGELDRGVRETLARRRGHVESQAFAVGEGGFVRHIVLPHVIQVRLVPRRAAKDVQRLVVHHAGMLETCHRCRHLPSHVELVPRRSRHLEIHGERVHPVAHQIKAVAALQAHREVEGVHVRLLVVRYVLRVHRVHHRVRAVENRQLGSELLLQMHDVPVHVQQVQLNRARHARDAVRVVPGKRLAGEVVHREGAGRVGENPHAELALRHGRASDVKVQLIHPGGRHLRHVGLVDVRKRPRAHVRRRREHQAVAVARLLHDGQLASHRGRGLEVHQAVPHHGRLQQARLAPVVVVAALVARVYLEQRLARSSRQHGGHGHGRVERPLGTGVAHALRHAPKLEGGVDARRERCRRHHRALEAVQLQRRALVPVP
mmetsp:Transcript_29047/g.55762  ORF Transcript_29047/g.55762 Transcript_29047/m.55762 type:complete len:480 (-) Transcript_29047:544-1983(-)